MEDNVNWPLFKVAISDRLKNVFCILNFLTP